MATNSARLQRLNLATPGTIARTHGVARETVFKAINDGRLPAYVVTTANPTRRGHFLIRPADADALWGLRKKPLELDPELVFA